MDYKLLALYLIAAVIVSFFVRAIINMIFTLNSSKMESTREKELKQQETKKSEEDNVKQIRQIIVKITGPVIDKVYKNKTPKNARLLKKKLKVAGQDKYFGPIEWTALVFILRFVGVVLFLGTFTASKAFAAILLIVFAAVPSFLLNNSFSNHKEALLLNFPETIKIMSGYLSAGKILPEAVEETAKNCSPIWSGLLLKFRAKCDTDGIENALDWFKEEVDIVEAKEFFTTIKLTLELGGTARKGFAEQADRIQDMLRDAMQKRIEKRKVWATVVQAPIFLCIMAAFALPVIGTFADIFGAS